MEKRLELHGKTAEGRPLIHLVEPGSHHGLADTGGLSKTASREHLPEVLELVEAIQPRPDRLYLVNSALGAGEFVGFNLRGDWFSEKGLTHVPPGWNNIPVWDIDARRKAAAQTEFVSGWGDMAWGYPTFYNAHRFRHHVNKDPNRAYGYILGAFWDHRMHRVILVSELVEDLCRKLGATDLYFRIKRGEFPDTSMGAKVPYDVCFAGDTFVATEQGPQQIRDIQLGDKVYTQQGSLKKVTRLFHRESENLLRLSVGGALDVETTHNHPYFRIGRDAVRGCHGSADGQKRCHSFYGKDTCHTCGASSLEIEQVPAEDLSVGDYLLTPVLKAEGPEYGPLLSYVAGVYAGDGSPIRQRRGRKKGGDYVTQGLVFACGTDDAHIDKLCAALSELSLNEPKIYDEGGGKNGVSVRIYDQELAKKILGMVTGKGSSKALVVPLAWHEDRLSFLGGLIDSDGSYDKKKGQSRFLNTSPRLARTAWWLAVQSRVHATVSTYEVAQGYTPGTQVFQVAFPASSSAVLSHYSCKVEHRDARVGSSSFFWRHGDATYYCSPVKGIEHLEGAREVFNLSVEDDETYIAEGMAVHNCSICGHVAKTPAKYCEHVQRSAMSPYGMRSILPDGRMCGVYNTYPRFFDDSFVFIGAERSAKTMANVTDQVRGQRSYGDQIYTPPPKMVRKVASYNPGENTPGVVGAPGAVPTNERQEQEQELGLALLRVGKAPDIEKSDGGPGEQVSSLLSKIPVAGEKERAALCHATEKLKKEMHIQDGTLTQAELDLWTSKELQDLAQKGVEPAQRDRMRSLVHHHMPLAYGMKKASAKWAEHLKRIPAPSKYQSSIVQDHASRMPRLPPDMLDHIKEDLVTRLRAAAALGVILTPEEFQYCHLPGARAHECMERKTLFSPLPVDPTHSPRWRVGAPSRSSVDAMASRLGGSLLHRSFAPKIVVIRISRSMGSPVPSGAWHHTEEHEDLNKVAQLYNDYRIGLLAQAPDWGYVSAPVGTSATIGEIMKVGDAAAGVSRLLLHLAYWPSLHLG